METGFYHPTRGYWQTSSEPSNDIISSYPEGTHRVPLKPGANFEFANGEWIAIPESLKQLRDQLKNEIDRAAEIERRKYITSGSGQAMTYMQKADEASRYLQASSPNPVNYPLLAAEVGITAPTLLEVAQIVHAAYSQWQVIGGAIEAARLSVKAAIDVAESADEARAAAAAIAWP